MNEIISISGKRILLVGSTGVLGRVYAAAIAEQDVQLIIKVRVNVVMKQKDLQHILFGLK